VNWSTVASLLGVVLGASLSLIGNVLSTRTTTAQAEAKHKLELRAERKEAIFSFLKEAQDYENFLSRLWNKLPLDLPKGVDSAREINNRNGEMWLKHRAILLMCSEPLRIASERYTRRLDDATYGGRPKGVATIWDFVREYRNNFLTAARLDIGVDLPTGAELQPDRHRKRPIFAKLGRGR
jgi:hypothetical protein